MPSGNPCSENTGSGYICTCRFGWTSPYEHSLSCSYRQLMTFALAIHLFFVGSPITGWSTTWHLHCCCSPPSLLLFPFQREHLKLPVNPCHLMLLSMELHHRPLMCLMYWISVHCMTQQLTEWSTHRTQFTIVRSASIVELAQKCCGRNSGAWYSIVLHNGSPNPCMHICMILWYTDIYSPVPCHACSYTGDGGLGLKYNFYPAN